MYLTRQLAAFELHLWLIKDMAATDWDLVSQILCSLVDKVFKYTQEKQQRKFAEL